MTRSPSRPSGPPAGPSQRQLRVGELIRRTLSEVLSRGDLHDPELAGVSITVGEVRVTPDLRQATAFVLPLGGTGGPEGGAAILAALARGKGELRHHLARAMTIRHVPDLRFRLDDTFDRMDATRRLLADERVRRDVAPEDEGAAGDDAEPEA